MKKKKKVHWEKTYIYKTSRCEVKRGMNSIHTWYEDMDSNTLTRFKECNSSMGTCVLEEGWFWEVLEDDWSMVVVVERIDGGGKP